MFIVFDFDFLAWKNNNYKNLLKYKKTKEYRFYLGNDQLKALETQFKQFKSENLNDNLEKLGENFTKNNYVKEVINFIKKDKKRPICTPFSK